MKQLLGVVMCGGESRRMGEDKGLKKAGLITWAQQACNKITQLGLPVVLSVNAAQVDLYDQLFDRQNLIVDSLNVKGPLNGILSAHIKQPDSDLLVLACDMTGMKSTTLDKMIQVQNNEPDHDFYAYHQEGFFEPLCAIYTSGALSGLIKIYQQGDLTNFSLQTILSNAKTKKLQVDDAASFHNVNNPGDVLF